MNFQDIILVVKNVLGHDECQSIIHEYEKKKIKTVKEASIPAFSDKVSKSNYRVLELDEQSPNYNLITSKMNFALQSWVNHLTNLNCFQVFGIKHVLKFPHKVRVLKYSENEYIHPHSDWTPCTHASVTLNLNNNYKGGKFVFMNGLFEVELDEGDALVFPADYFWVHEVTKVTEGERYSVNSFILSHSLHFAEKIRKEMAAEQTQGIFNIK